MEISDHLMLFYVHDRAELYEATQMQGLLQALAAKGYALFTVAEGAVVEPQWREWTVAVAGGTDGPSPVPAGVSSQAVAAVAQFCADRQKRVTLQGIAVATAVTSKGGKRLLNGFEWSLGFDADEGMIYLTYLRHHFTVGQDEWEAYAHWLGIVQAVYQHWHPIYGYAFDPRGGENDTPRKEILAHKITYLYDINVFGPEIVAAIGRERVESAPAQIVTKLDDGGILLVPSENLLPDFPRYSYSQVAAHLELASPGM